METKPPIILAENLTKVYMAGRIPVPAVRGISLAVKRGEFVSIVGPSGSGKSTLFYLLGGLTRRRGGRVADEHEVDAGGLGGAGAGVVVGGDHHDRFAESLLLHQQWQGHRQAAGSDGAWMLGRLDMVFLSDGRLTLAL